MKAIEEAGPLTPLQCLDGRALIALDGTKHLVHLVGIDDSVGALRRTGSHLSQFPANEVSGPGAIGVNPAVMRVDPLDLQGRVSCRLTRLHRCNCRLSMNGN